MTQMFGRRGSTSLKGDKIISTFLIEARSESQAERRAKNNLRVAGEREYKIDDIEVEEEYEDSASDLYRVKTEYPR